jgi:hypothetical protein
MYLDRMNTQLSGWWAKNWRSIMWQSAILILWVTGTVLEHLGYRTPGLITTAVGLGVLVACASRDHVFSIEQLRKDALEAKLYIESHRQTINNLEVTLSNLAHKVTVENPMLKEEISDLSKWVRPKVGQLNDLIGEAAKQLGELTASSPATLPAEDTVQDQKDGEKVSDAPENPPATPTHFRLPSEVVIQSPPPAAPVTAPSPNPATVSAQAPTPSAKPPVAVSSQSRT